MVVLSKLYMCISKNILLSSVHEEGKHTSAEFKETGGHLGFEFFSLSGIQTLSASVCVRGRESIPVQLMKRISNVLAFRKQILMNI